MPRTRRALHRHRQRAVARLLFRSKLGPEAALELRAARERRSPPSASASPAAPTAVSCCGANPGMVSWFVKQALLELADDTGLERQGAEDPRGLGAARQAGSASRASTSPSATPSAPSIRSRCDVFVNTWSVEGFVSEGLQPAELGWGTHEKWMPANGRKHKTGCQAAIYLLQPGADTRVRSWTPDRARPNTASWSRTTSRSRSPTTSPCASGAQGRSTGRPATTPITRQRRGAVAARDVRRGRQAAGRDRTSSTRTRSSTASTSSACCSTATRRTPTGTARSSRSTRRASSRPIRTRPACR